MTQILSGLANSPYGFIRNEASEFFRNIPRELPDFSARLIISSQLSSMEVRIIAPSEPFGTVQFLSQEGLHETFEARRITCRRDAGDRRPKQPVYVGRDTRCSSRSERSSRQRGGGNNQKPGDKCRHSN